MANNAGKSKGGESSGRPQKKKRPAGAKGRRPRPANAGIKSASKGNRKGEASPNASDRKPITKRPVSTLSTAAREDIRGYPAPYDNATPERPVSPYFSNDQFVTYEGSRIPWWVRIMWIVFWIICAYYVVVLAWPDAQRYF